MTSYATTHVLADLVERVTGLALDRGGVSAALDRFVAERMATLSLRRLDEYIALASDPTSSEQRRLIDAITVQHTWFYRDAEQLQTIAKILGAAPPGPLAIWVAGCATGEEAYTLAIIGRRIHRDVRIVATDVNETALATARRGVYGPAALRDVPDLERRWFQQRDNVYVVDRSIQDAVSFVRHNLVELPPAPPPGMRGGWDLIVCRNVLIYFAPAAADRLLERFARAIKEGGSLVVGASEVVFEPPPGLELISADRRLVLRRPLRPPSNVAPQPTPTNHISPLRPNARAVTEPRGLTEPRTITERNAVITEPRTITERNAVVTERNAVVTERNAVITEPRTTTERNAVVTERSGVFSSQDLTAPGPAVREAEMVTTLNRGHGLFARGDVVAAIRVYEELSDRAPDIAEPFLFLGIARYTHGETVGAAKALRAALCLDTKLWPAIFYLARCYERLGQRQDALQQYDLIAVDDLQPLALRSDSPVINELRALSHDVRTAARRVSSDRGVSLRRI